LAQVGELLPVFTQWVNPNETFKIGYNGKTRTAALNTDAFTRIRENIQYYFVPFQSLWKYFEQQVNNMTKGDAGQNISMIASSSSDPATLTTSLPYVSYNDTLEKANTAPTSSQGSYASQVRTSSTGSILVGFRGKLTADSSSSLKISALRSATALQKYREIRTI
jgi:hypothetical protein